MRRQVLGSCVAALALATTAFAQRFEVFGDYTHMRYNPTITGLNSRSLNGGGGGALLNFAKILGLKADFQGYVSTQTVVQVTAPIYSQRNHPDRDL
jgi:hypothetical protein